MCSRTMAILKHIASKSSNYGAALEYLIFKHDEFRKTPILDQNGNRIMRIKARVLEQTGLKVSSLYISQVKQKCGLEVRENHHKAKSENTKQPQCPPEKEAAIRDALKYFKMI